MSAAPYLFDLAERLARGAAQLDPERRARHRQFLLSRQKPDGGFVGREGDSDLYYTSFAIRALALLQGLEPDDAERAAAYLRSIDWRRLGVLDLMNWLSTALAVQSAAGIDLLATAEPDWPEQVAARLEAVRRSDGGYAKSTEGALGSTYHSFLVALTYELIGRSVPRPQALVQFLYDRQRDDGGFVEIAPMRRSGTNPTAAAAALLLRLGAMDSDLASDVCGFLEEVRGDEGGFQANTRIPFADGLSTFTGLLTAWDLGRADVIDPRRVEQFIRGSLESPTGGFRAAAWDDSADVEYTFYGLGTLALLSAPPSPV